jgi:hypothetical protein
LREELLLEMGDVDGHGQTLMSKFEACGGCGP